MAGGTYIAPVAPKGDTTVLIPFRPQQDINQYLCFNSALNHTKDGSEYVQRCRTSPQRSYKLNYKLTGLEADRMESLLNDPELFYLPLWEQAQKYTKKINIGDTYINNYTTLSTNEMVFWLFKNYFELWSDIWMVPDYIGLGGYYETLAWQNSTIPLKNNILFGDTYSVCFDFDNNGYTTDLKTLIKSQGSTNHFYLYPNVYHNGRVYVELSATCNCYSSELKITDTGFTKVCIVFNKTANTAKFYFDGVYDTGSTVSGTIPTLDYTSMSILGATGGSWKFRNIVFTSHEMTATEIAHYANNNISAIANKTLWLPCNEANTFQTPSGLGNASNIYVNTGIAANTITTFVIRWKYNYEVGTALYGAINGTPLQRYAILRPTATPTSYYVYLGNGAVWDINSYMVENHIMEMTLVHNGSLSYTITLKDITEGTTVFTDTQTADGIIATNSLYIFARNYSTTVSTSQSIYYFKINTQEWYLRPYTSNSIKGSLGTSLTVNGTLTNFWVNDEPYTDVTVDRIAGNNGTPTAIIPANFLHASADAILQGNRPNTEKNYLASGSFFTGQSDEVKALESLFTTDILSDYITRNSIVRDYESKHLLFANNDNAKVKDVIGFSSARSALTTPTLEQVLYYDADCEFTATGYDFYSGQWVLVWQDKDNYEFMTVDTVSGNKVVFTSAFTKEFLNPIIVPVFKAVLLGSPTWSKNDNILYCSLDFMLIRNLDFAAYTPDETYDSVMVLTKDNYYSDRTLDNTLDSEMILTDFGFGAVDYYKNFKQSVNIKTFGLKATGRTEISDMLKFINYCNGQQREIWVPRLQPDFIALSNISAIQTVIEVNNKGLTKIAANAGFNRAVMLYLNGSYYYSSVTSITEISETVEELTIGTAFGVAVDIENDEYFICWLIKSCLNTDQVEIRYKINSAYALLNFREQQA